MSDVMLWPHTQLKCSMIGIIQHYIQVGGGVMDVENVHTCFILLITAVSWIFLLTLCSFHYLTVTLLHCCSMGLVPPKTIGDDWFKLIETGQNVYISCKVLPSFQSAFHNFSSFATLKGGCVCVCVCLRDGFEKRSEQTQAMQGNMSSSMAEPVLQIFHRSALSNCFERKYWHP